MLDYRLMALGNVFRSPSYIGRVNGCARMCQVFHRLAHRDVIAGHPAGNSDAQGVKARIRVGAIFPFESGPFQQPKPFVAPAVTQLGVGFGDSPGLEFLEKWNEVRVQWFCGMTIAFLFEPDQSQFGAICIRRDFHVGHGVQPGFIKPHPMVTSDQEAVAKAGPHWFWFEFDLNLDAFKLLIGKFGVEPTIIFFQTKFVAGVVVCITARYRLAHDNTQNPEFEQGRITPGLVFSERVVGMLPPFGIVHAMFASKLTGERDLLFVKVYADGFPRTQIAALAARAFVLSFFEPRGCPNVPRFLSGVSRQRAFGQRFCRLKLARLSGFVANADAEAGGLTFNDVAVRVAEFNPPERRSILFIKRCHCAMPNYAYANKKRRICSSFIKHLQTISSVKQNRGFESPPLRHFRKWHLKVGEYWVLFAGGASK